MDLLPWLLCAALAVALAAAIAKIALLRKSMDEICAEFGKAVSEDTNVQVSISSGDRAARRLAAEINLQLSELRKLRRRYGNGDRELKEAVTNISHDLRTPLTALCGYLDLLERQELPEDAERHVAQIRNRAEALRQLTEELFRYSVVASVTSLSCEKADLRRALEESLISFEAAMRQVGIVPEIELPDIPVWRVIDPSAASRVFGNIVGNAIRYSDGDLVVRMGGDGVVSFENGAKGLSAVEAGKLFDRFYTVDPARKSTGLGLAIAKTLIEQMGGEIEAAYDNGRLRISVSFR